MLHINEDNWECVIVVQGGALELQALLLVASIRKHVGAGWKITAAVPDNFGLPCKETFDFLEKHGVHFSNFHNQIIDRYGIKKPQLRITNKIYALSLPAVANKTILLDTDSFFRSDFQPGFGFSAPLSLLYSDSPGEERETMDWGGLFRRFDIQTPLIRLARFRDGKPCRLVPPNFHSSCICVSSDVRDELAELWLETWERLYLDDKELGYHIGQYAFTLAVHKFGMPYHLINPYFRCWYHYSNTTWFLNDKKILKQISLLLRENQEILEIFALVKECPHDSRLKQFARLISAAEEFDKAD